VIVTVSLHYSLRLMPQTSLDIHTRNLESIFLKFFMLTPRRLSQSLHRGNG
jgi:hypothetical protein